MHVAIAALFARVFFFDLESMPRPRGRASRGARRVVGIRIVWSARNFFGGRFDSSGAFLRENTKVNAAGVAGDEKITRVCVEVASDRVGAPKRSVREVFDFDEHVDDDRVVVVTKTFVLGTVSDVFPFAREKYPVWHDVCYRGEVTHQFLLVL